MQGDFFAPEVNPAMVVLAREARGLNQSTVALALKITQAHYSKLEAGLTPVSDHHLQRLSGVLHLPSSFFARTDPVYGPSVAEFFHRKRQAVSQRLLSQLHATLNMRRMEIARLLRAVDIGDLNVPRFSTEDLDGPEAVADAMRAAWMLPSGPIDDLVAHLEAAGILVMELDFGTPLVDAVSQWVPGLLPMLFVNTAAPGDRLRLTVAHELGHMVMHREPHAQMEAEANAFAAAFLMPPRDILPDFHRVSLERLAALKPYWKVSMQAILVHAYRLGRISEHHYQRLWAEMGKAGYRRREPAELEVARESPKLLAQIVDVHLNDLSYSPADLGALVNLIEDEAIGIYLSRRGSGSRRLRIVT